MLYDTWYNHKSYMNRYPIVLELHNRQNNYNYGSNFIFYKFIPSKDKTTTTNPIINNDINKDIMNNIKIYDVAYKDKDIFCKLEEVYGIDDDQSKSNDCVICMSDQANTILLPCRHLCICKDCGKKLSNCPICRVSIENHIKLVDEQQYNQCL